MDLNRITTSNNKIVSERSISLISHSLCLFNKSFINKFHDAIIRKLISRCAILDAPKNSEL